MNTNLQFTYILNEHSRNGHKALKQIKQYSDELDYTYTVHKTQYPGHAFELARSLAPKLSTHNLLVVVGGDGTLSEVINGLESKNADCPIGYIPTGSGNDFARSHNIPLTIQASIQYMLQTTKPRQLDIIEIQHKHRRSYALNSFGVGIDGMVIHSLAESKLKNLIGNAAYFSSILYAYFKQRPFNISIDAGKHSLEFSNILLAVCVNHRFFGGGIPIHPKADPTDSVFELVIAEKVSFSELLSLLIRVILKKDHLAHKKMHVVKVADYAINIQSHQYGQHDGELKEFYGDYTISSKKRAFWIR
ncbi:diacylglycerol kinase family protein [Marinilactibacillus sp. Marseille-P9653]|uniref:diacylglycerol/lipid kinase family protein n=1 Tax=Marinilactibacillus sp. Marseille-P9653 TaxID=2866583 RepID=UPI001CE3C854|nr:YegS/Rv2252/BmrU family lipid kinase [Marinilactibacillus sp. Marseille-P9653]